MILFGDINKGLKECHATPGAVLVDVRERTEYASGETGAERLLVFSGKWDMGK